MVFDARHIANAMLDIAEDEKISLSHLALQKILFFAHAWTLAATDKPLVGQPFEAWKFGPVIRVVFEQLKGSSAPIGAKRLKCLNIESGNYEIPEVNLDAETERLLSSTVRYYGRFHAGKLVDLTHDTDGPWDKVWRMAGDKAVLGMVIRNNDIKSWALTRGLIRREEDRYTIN